MAEHTPTATSTDIARRMISELRRGRDQLATQVTGFTEAELARGSASAEWDVAQVLSHLGSGAEIAIATLGAALADEELPGQDASEAIWTRWNGMTRVEQAAGWLATTERHLAGLEALSEEQLATLNVPFPFFPAPLDAAGFLALRLNEQALHHWDVEVAFDDNAVIPGPAADLLIDRLPGMLRWMGHADRWTGPEAHIAVTTTAPSRDWTLSIGEAVEVVEQPAEAADARLTMPSETFIRLAAGRLRGTDTSRVVVDGPLELPDVDALFPGF